jgi:hypothetical protein
LVSLFAESPKSENRTPAEIGVVFNTLNVRMLNANLIMGLCVKLEGFDIIVKDII